MPQLLGWYGLVPLASETLHVSKRRVTLRAPQLCRLLCAAGLFQPEDGQFGCLSCDGLGDFIQPLDGQTSCQQCENNTQRYVGVLSATNRSSCQCKKGLHSSAIPLRCSNVEIQRREYSGYYHPEAKAGEVSCVLSIAQNSRLSNLQAPVRPVLSDAVRYTLELAECFVAGMLCVPGRGILWWEASSPYTPPRYSIVAGRPVPARRGPYVVRARTP